MRKTHVLALTGLLAGAAMAFSSALAMAASCASRPNAPTTWMPNGMPFWSSPQGRLNAGLPLIETPQLIRIQV